MSLYISVHSKRLLTCGTQPYLFPFLNFPLSGRGSPVGHGTTRPRQRRDGQQQRRGPDAGTSGGARLALWPRMPCSLTSPAARPSATNDGVSCSAASSNYPIHICMCHILTLQIEPQRASLLLYHARIWLELRGGQDSGRDGWTMGGLEGQQGCGGARMRAGE